MFHLYSGLPLTFVKFPSLHFPCPCSFHSVFRTPVGKLKKSHLRVS